MREVNYRIPKRLLKNVFILIALIAALFTAKREGAIKSVDGNNRFYVKRIVDGDTIVLSNNQRVRYIGMNTPEIHHPKKPVEWMGPEAADFNRRLVEHKWVTLEFDAELRDRYGRLLAYVYVDGVMVNAELVKEGYADVYTFPPNVKYRDLFTRLRNEAQAAHKGIWKRP
ncbi:MAG: thermonuclease family protein [Candidatus Omnitrophica bacterium]|nr:thermonuclease family protein [Candidatus Omnitrophota bacterium]